MSDTEVALKDSPVRDDKGRFAKGKSGNPRGRKKGTTGNKHKFAKQSLENMLFKFGPEALKNIMKMAQDAMQKNDGVTAFKCLVFISGKYYDLIVHNEKISIQEAQMKAKAESEEESQDTSDNGQVEVTFTPFKIA